jgi:eukaryotic-like serine/threonine-protein kinase
MRRPFMRTALFIPTAPRRRVRYTRAVRRLSLVALITALAVQMAPGAGASTHRTEATRSTGVDWPQFHFGTDRDGATPDTTLTKSNVAGLKMHWRTELYSTGGYSGSSPAVVGGTIYLGSDNDKVYAVKASTGSVLWSYKTGGAVDSSPAVVNGVVYIGSDDGKLYALNASTGAKIWSFTTGAEIATSSPLVSGTLVYVGSHDGYFYAVKTSNGSLAWKSPNIWQIWKGGALANGIIYVGTDKSMLYAFDANTGATKWSATLGNRVRSNPAVSGGVVYVGCDNGRLYAFDASTGSLKWKTASLPGPSPILMRSSPAVSNGVVYISTSEGTPATANGHQYAFNTSNGSQKWVAGFSDMSGASPVVANGMVFNAEYGHQAYVFDANTGTKLWKSGFDTFKGTTDSMAVVNGNVYFLNIDGYLYDYGL